MKVVHLDSGREWRGGQRQVLLLMRGLRERNIENVLYAPAGPLDETARGEGFTMRRWESGGDLDLAAVWRARTMLRQDAPDVVHCHSGRAHALGAPAARLAGRAPVVVSRRVDFRVGRNPFSALKYAYGVDVFICISRGVHDIMRAAGIPEHRLRIVHSGVSMESRHSGADLRSDLGLPADARVVGTIAAFGGHKNHVQLLRAAPEVVRRHPEAHFVWLGEGVERARLERMRAELGLETHVHMPGHRDDAAGLLNQFDVFAMTSSEEGLGTSLLDAQVAGVPIITSPVGGITDIVTDGVTGRLVPVGDVSGTSRAIIEALEHPERTSEWVENARRSVQAFSAARMVEGTLEIYRELVGLSGAANAGDGPSGEAE